MSSIGIMPAGTNVDPSELSHINFSDHSTLQKPLLIISAVSIVAVFVTVSLRVFTRLSFMKSLFADDVLAIVAALFIFATCGSSLAGWHLGLGKHAWNLNVLTILEDMKAVIQILFITYIVYACALFFTKLSIIATYLRIIPSPTFRKVIYAITLIVTFNWIAGVFVTIFQCKPVEAAWDFSIADRKCLPYVEYLYVSSSVNMVTDVLLCLLPLKYIWMLQVPIKQRVVVCTLFGVGFMACIASIIRLTTLREIGGIDVTYSSAHGLIWTIVECALGLISVSIPPLRPLAKHLLSTSPLQSLFSSHHSAKRIGDANTHSKRSKGFGWSRGTGDGVKEAGETELQSGRYWDIEKASRSRPLSGWEDPIQQQNVGGVTTEIVGGWRPEMEKRASKVVPDH